MKFKFKGPGIIFYRLPLKILLLMILMTFTNCQEEKKPQKISLEKKELLSEIDQDINGQILRIAVGAMITPKAGFEYYKYLLDFIGEKIGKRVIFVDRGTYREINHLLKSNKLDAAFICSGPYVDAHDEFGLEILVVPEAYGKTVYHSYIITPVNSPATKVGDLKGKNFAFTDPDSNTGMRVPSNLLYQMGETPESFFKKYYFAYQHDKAILSVAEKYVDGAAVDSLIWEYMNIRQPEITSKTKIIWKSKAFGIPPFVVRPQMDPKIKAELRNILLNIHQDKKGQSILKGMMIDRFVLANDRNYDSIRDLTKNRNRRKIK